MFPTIIDGKLMVPITPSIIETAPGEWLCVDGMSKMMPDEEGYDMLMEYVRKHPWDSGSADD
jgi:hypothetical protein